MFVIAMVDIETRDEADSGASPQVSSLDVQNRLEEDDDAMDIEEAVDRVGHGWYQNALLIALGIGFSGMSTEFLLLQFLSATLQTDWGLSIRQVVGLFGSAMAGQIVGAPLLGLLADRYGRRPLFLAASAVTSLFGFLSAASNTYTLLVVFRCLVGFGLGGTSVTFDLLAEICPKATRGRFLLYMQLFGALTTLLVILLAFLILGSGGPFSPQNHPQVWRLLVSHAAILPLISTLLGYIWLPESPRWLLARGMEYDAADVLLEAAHSNGKEFALTVDTRLEMDNDEKVKDPCELFHSKLQPTAFLVMALWTTSSMGYYGAVELGTSHIFDEPTENSFDYSSLTLNTSADALGVLLAHALVYRLSRSTIQVLAYVGGATVAGGYYALDPIQTLIFFFGRIFLSTGLAVTWLTTVDKLPTGLRASAHSIGFALSQVGALTAFLLTTSDTPFVVLGLLSMLTSLISAGCSAFWKSPTTKSTSEGIGDSESKHSQLSEQGTGRCVRRRSHSSHHSAIVIVLASATGIDHSGSI